MNAMRLAIATLFLAAAPLHAQSPGEIAFWESVRDSKNPAELRAYLQQYPNGTFKALAESRLATLERSPPAARPAAPIAAPPSSITSATRMPQAGDSWTYRLSYPRLRGQWGQRDRAPRMYVVTLKETGEAIIDMVSVDGGTPVEAKHEKGAALISQEASIFSPYLQAFTDLPASGRLRAITIADPGCRSPYVCEVKGSVAGRETITVPAGTFNATRIVITHEWRPGSGSVTHAAQMAQYQGGRTLTVWYVPEIKRAVKYSSRLLAGDVPPVDANFDLDLVSYNLK